MNWHIDDLRAVKYRPASEKEYNEDGREIRRMKTTYILTFHHILDPDGVFKITAQMRSPGKTRDGRIKAPVMHYNLHEPHIVRAKEYVDHKRVTQVTRRSLTETVTIKSSSGGYCFTRFFEGVLVERFSDPLLRLQIQVALLGIQ